MSLDELPGAGNLGTADVASEPVQLPSPAEGVVLWTFALSRSAVELGELDAVLSVAERERAARFGTQALRERYVIGRGTLRRLLGDRLGCAPAAVAIRRGLRGRPQVEEAAGLDFNVTHAAGVALVGFATAGRIGVDIEHRDRRLNVEGVSRKFMSAPELAYLATLEPDSRRQALLRLWTCKEAMSKATGEALSAPFRRMDVAVAADLALRDGPAPYLPAQWRLIVAQATSAFIATVALWSGRG